MIDGRIRFAGTPRPEGHPITGSAWTSRQEGSRIWLDLHLRSAGHDSGGEIEDSRDHAFRIHLIGHDTAVNHCIVFRRTGGSGLFDLEWTGAITLTHAGRRHSPRPSTLPAPPAPSAPPPLPTERHR